MKTAMTLSIFFLFFPLSVLGHGVMCTPRQRGAYRAADKCGTTLPNPPNPVVDYCPHCLNGGAVGTVLKNLPSVGWTSYNPLQTNFTLSSTRAGMCGDAKFGNDHMLGGKYMPYATVPFVAKYRAGADIDLSVEIDTNHNGYFSFFICNLDECDENDISPRCFAQKKCYQLTRVAHPACENPNIDTKHECGPVDPLHPGRFYVPCRKTSHVGVHVVGGPRGTMRYRLPEGVTCRHCVIQWYWATANSCAPPGFLSYFERFNDPFGTTCPGDGGAVGGRRKGMSTCGAQAVPEEFWSCADVQVGSKTTFTPDANDEITAATPRVSSTPKPSPSPFTTFSPKWSSTPNIAVPASPAPITTPQVTTGSCVAESGTCDGSSHCCDSSNVCAWRKSVRRFSCVKWWELHNEGQKESCSKLNYE